MVNEAATVTLKCRGTCSKRFSSVFSCSPQKFGTGALPGSALAPLFRMKSHGNSASPRTAPRATSAARSAARGGFFLENTAIEINEPSKPARRLFKQSAHTKSLSFHDRFLESQFNGSATPTAVRNTARAVAGQQGFHQPSNVKLAEIAPDASACRYSTLYSPIN